MDSVELPHAWLSQFDGSNLENKLHVAAVLGTVDDAGWPHLVYLSAGEVLTHSTHRLSFALWPTSRSTANLRRVGHAVLHAVADGAVWEARLVAQSRADANDLVVFDAEVIGVHRHAAPYAEVTGLIGFRLNDPASTLDRWRRQIERMREIRGITP
jgi:flavin reductase (DIM6/NTAB) family NADH-FMN oxidoreductase RutF